jgi:hypothetical protein
LDRLYRCFRNLRSRRWWRDRVYGGAAFLEVTWSDDLQAWHPHLHILLDSKWLPQSELAAEWLSVTHDSFVVDVRLVACSDKVASYVVKYAAKPLSSTFLNRPDQLQEAIRAFTGRRCILTFGKWSGLKPLPDTERDEWETVAPLRELIAARDAGDATAARILAALNGGRTCKTEPPLLPGLSPP